jgi:hypothetical protein
MTKMKKALFFLFSFCSLAAYAQNDLTLSFMENIYQATYVNPTAVPVYKVSLGLPVISSVGMQVTNTGFSYGDLIQRDSKYTNDTLRGNIGNAYRQLDDQNYLYAGFETDLFHFRVKARSLYVSLFAQVKTQFRYSYPKNFMDLVVNGNGDKIGQNIEFKNLGADIDMYSTIGLGLAKESKHWIIGGNLKYLNGIANMNFDPGRTSGVHFDNEYYAFRSLSDMTINSSGFSEDLDPESFTRNYQDATGKINQNSILKKIDLTKNPGAAIDLGLTYKYNDKWHFTLSVLNFGYINWKSDVYNRKIYGGKDFAGFDVFGYFLRGESKPDAEAESEFKNSFQYTVTKKSYKKWLIPQFYFSIRYNVTPKTHLGVMTYWEYYKKWRPAFTVSAYHKFGRVLNIVATYSIQYSRFDNIGLGIMAKLGSCQFYVGGDNVIAPLVRAMTDGFEVGDKTVDPMKTFNLRAGMNLVFGGFTQPTRQSYEFQDTKK